MVDILHRVGIKSSNPEVVYEALTKPKALAAWWTDDVQGKTSIGDELTFRFGDKGFFVMKILELAAPYRVLWQVADGPAEWIGTKVSFDLKQEEDYTIIIFKQEGWKEPVEFMHHCSTKWAIFLMSLKQLVETGKGSAFPNDLKIDNWN